MKSILLAILMVINLNQFLNPNHTELFQSTDFELVVRGGFNAGKTYSIVDKCLIQSIWQSDRHVKAVLLRKTLPSLKNSVLDILERRAEKFKLPLRINKNENTATCHKMKFVFLSLNNKEDFAKVKSMTDVDIIWVNEVNEIRENDYEILLTRIRGGEGKFKQFIIDFNPIGKTSWVYERFYQKNVGNARKLKYTVLDNPWATEREIASLRALKDHNLNLYNVGYLGEWGELEGIIYNWDVVPLPTTNLKWYDEIFYGGDFGYSVDPAVLIRIYRKSNEFWLEEVIYETGLTNQALGRKMKDAGVGDALNYWDSAEPKSIQELCDMGFTAKPADKGPDSVRAGIDFLCEQKIHIVEGSENIAKEQKSYVRKQDKDGNFLPDPIDFNNHAMDASRYGIFTHCKTDPGYFGYSKEAVY